MIKCQGAAVCVQEQAFVHKYPVRDPSGWQDKALKYKPGCSSDAYDIAMGPLVSVIVCTAFFHLLPKPLCKQGMFTWGDQSKACYYKFAVYISCLASCAYHVALVQWLELKSQAQTGKQICCAIAH